MLLRKTGLVLVLLLVDDIIVQSILGVFVVMIVMGFSLAARPLIRTTYHFYSTVEMTVEIAIMLLGIIVAARHRSGTIVEGSSYSADEHPGEEQYVAVAILGVAATVGLSCTYHDVLLIVRQRRVARLRTNLGIRLPEAVFRLGAKGGEYPSLQLIQWLEAKSQDAQLRARMRAMEVMLVRAYHHYSMPNFHARCRRYEQQVNAEPALVSWLSRSGAAAARPLADYVSSLLPEKRHEKKHEAKGQQAKQAEPDVWNEVTSFFTYANQPKLALWLSEGATEFERSIVRNLIAEMTHYFESSSADTNGETADSSQQAVEKTKDGGKRKKGRINSTRRRKSSVMAVLDAVLARGQGPRSLPARGSSGEEDKSSLMTKALETFLAQLIEHVNCEMVLLIPISTPASDSEAVATHATAELPKILVQPAGCEDDKDRELFMGQTDWALQLDSPAAMAARTGEAVRVGPKLLDKRFELPPGQGRERLACLSEMCIPVHANGLEATFKLDREHTRRGPLRKTGAELQLVGVICCINKTNHAGSATGLSFTVTAV